MYNCLVSNCEGGEKRSGNLSKIRNLTLRELPGGTLFPDIEKQYDDYSIRELLHNCLAHEDYLDAKDSFMTSEKGMEYQDNVMITS